jgi:hypothetical protein
MRQVPWGAFGCAVCRGAPAILISETPGSSPGPERGSEHTSMDTLDKVSARLIQIDAARAARLALRLVVGCAAGQLLGTNRNLTFENCTNDIARFEAGRWGIAVSSITSCKWLATD